MLVGDPGRELPLFATINAVCARAFQSAVGCVDADRGALLWSRNVAPAQLLAAALLAVLLADPWAVLAPGFWLSFGAVMLILYVTAHRLPHQPQHWYQRLWQNLCEASRVQWAMTIGLLPLLLAMFQQVSLISPVANAVAVPLISLMVVPLTLLGTALPFDLPLHLAESTLDMLLQFLKPLNALPQAVWLQHDPPAWSILLGAVGAVWLLLPRGLPARWLGALWLLPMFLTVPPAPPADTARVSILDVGQGLSVVVQTRQHALLYDSGPDYSGDSDSGKRVVIPNLRAAGIAELDGLILSHDDNDHAGGATSVLQAMPVGWIRTSMQPAAVEADFGRDAQPCLAGQTWDWDGVQFTVLHPTAADYDREHARLRAAVTGPVRRLDAPGLRDTRAAHGTPAY